MQLKNEEKDVDNLTKSVLEVLAQRKETKLIPQVGEALKLIGGRNRNQNSGIVASVVPLNDQTLSRIKKITQTHFQREIELKNQLDPGLLGGFRVEIGDWVMDASLKADFSNLQKALLS